MEVHPEISVLGHLGVGTGHARGVL
jgi:hypothetical protein